MMSSVGRKIWEYLALTLGTLSYCFAWDAFMIPNNLSSGGLTGLCTVLQYVTGDAIPMSISFVVINAVLLLIGFAVIGGKFGFKTIYCIVLSTIVFKYLPLVDVIKSLPGHFLYVPERFLIPVIAGIFEGLGIGIIMENGGSTGGSDIIAMILNKFWPISLAKAFLILDAIVITSILIVPGAAFSDMIYGYLMMIMFSVTIDFVQTGRRSTVQVLIFSDRYDEIADYINSEMDRGVTALQAVGWYTKSDRKVLLAICRKKELHEITNMVKSIDRNAFVSVAPASSVYGEGFEEIKTGLSKLKKSKGNA